MELKSALLSLVFAALGVAFAAASIHTADIKLIICAGVFWALFILVFVISLLLGERQIDEAEAV